MTASYTTDDRTETLFVGTFLHSIHRAYAERVDADLFYLFGPEYERWDDIGDGAAARLRYYLDRSREIPTGYDCYLLEGGTALIPGLLFKLRRRDATTVLLNADETFINAVEGLDHYGPADAYVHRLCARSLDGVVSVGGFADDYLRRAGVTAPSVVAYPGIDDEVYDRLGEVPVDVDSGNVVAVGYGRHHPRRTGGSSTGFDLLVDAMPRVRDRHPETELHVAGEGHPPEWDDREGVHLHGWVDDLGEFFARGEVSAHPGRSESFSVAALEPMRAGRPCLVSDMVGAKEVVADVSPDLVCRPTADSVATGLADYLDRPGDERRTLCRRARDRTAGFRESEVVEGFADAYARLRRRIDRD